MAIARSEVHSENPGRKVNQAWRTETTTESQREHRDSRATRERRQGNGNHRNTISPQDDGESLPADVLRLGPRADLDGYMVFFVALGEEVGWRGYALPALQARYSALVSSVVLGALWALWHLPHFFNPDLHYSRMPFVLQLVFQIPAAILFTWVFNSTRGSVLLAILMHAVLNASSRLWGAMPEYSVEPPTAAEAAAQTVHINVMFAIVVGVAALVVVLVYGPRNLSRHPREMLATASGPENRGCNNHPPPVLRAAVPCTQTRQSGTAEKGEQRQRPRFMENTPQANY